MYIVIYKQDIKIDCLAYLPPTKFLKNCFQSIAIFNYHNP